MSVEKLLADHGLDPDETLAWAKTRASALLEQLEDPNLQLLLEGTPVDLPTATASDAAMIDEVTRVEAAPSAPAEVTGVEDAPDYDPAIDVETRVGPAPTDEEATSDELEELDVEELEELDMDEVDLVEEEGEAPEDEDGDDDEDGDHDFLADDPSAGANEEGAVNYAPTDTQPLDVVDAEILDDSGSFAVDDLAEPDGTPVQTGDTQTQMETAAVADAAPEEVKDEGSGDLFGEDDLDIDIEL